MNVMLITMATLVMMVCRIDTTTVNSLQSNNVASDYIMKRIRKELDKLQSFIKDIVKGKCDGMNEKGMDLCLLLSNSRLGLTYHGYTN